VQTNRGYRRCAKPAWVTSPALDLWHANLHALRRHRDRQAAGDGDGTAPGPLLVLEDDVEFTPELRRRAADIEDFIMQPKNRVEAYNLGCIPLVALPPWASWRRGRGPGRGRDHIRCLWAGAAHAVIYSAAAQERIRRTRPFYMHDLQLSASLRLFVPRVPCAVQKMTPDTESAKRWCGSNPLIRAYLRAFNADADGSAFYNAHHRSVALGGLVPLTLLAAGVVVALLALALSPLSLPALSPSHFFRAHKKKI
jgi:hypothetical protein